MIIKDLIVKETGKGIEVMEGVVTKEKRKTGFVYCPCCGLRIPKSEMSKYYGGLCPACGTQLVEEGMLPYASKSNTVIENNIDAKILRKISLSTVDSTECVNSKNTSKVETQTFPGDTKKSNTKELDQIKELTKAILVNPDDAELYFIRATLKTRIGDIKGAKSDFKLSEICDNKKNLELENYPLVKYNYQ